MGLVSGQEAAEWTLAPHGGKAKGSAIGWLKDGILTAGFVVDEYNGKNCFVHIRIEGAPRAFWFAMVDWVFNELGCLRMTAPVASSNVKCVKLLNRMRWNKEAVLADSAYDGSDLILFSWKKESCYILGWGKK